MMPDFLASSPDLFRISMASFISSVVLRGIEAHTRYLSPPSAASSPISWEFSLRFFMGGNFRGGGGGPCLLVSPPGGLKPPGGILKGAPPTWCEIQDNPESFAI